MNEPASSDDLAQGAALARARLGALRDQIHRVIVGQDDLIDRLVVGLLCNGHILMEGVPGLAKTLCVTTLARVLDAGFRRIQFTPDLLPGDLLGGEIYSPQTATFTTRKGPIFANLILADEINRAPAKVQSALLEAMQEHQVTIGGQTHPLPEPFIVVATQNPIEQEGTYPLPEAQVDRFMLKLVVPYPTRDEERKIIDRMAVSSLDVNVKSVLTPEEVLAFRALADSVYVDGRACDYVLDLVRCTRQPPPELGLQDLIQWGASPRASMYIVMAARARALMDGRAFVTPDDVKAVAPDVLRHRVILTFEAEAEGVRPDAVVDRVLGHVPVP